ncbi:MAG: 50S ribosomal protein L3 [Clostridia bacterium]
MVKEIYGKKLGMTQIFSEDGMAVPVSVIEVEPNTVVQKKVAEKEGYNAIVVAFGNVKEKNANKPHKGIFAKASVGVKKYLREIRLEDVEAYELGNEITLSIFEAKDKVDVQGMSKGKGFAGTIKRYNGHRGPMTHGSMYHRRTGSLGAGTDPGRVFKGKKMPGNMGNDVKTIQNLEVVKIDTDKNVILLKGSVPGAKGSFVKIKASVK